MSQKRDIMFANSAATGPGNSLSENDWQRYLLQVQSYNITLPLYDFLF